MLLPKAKFKFSWRCMTLPFFSILFPGICPLWLSEQWLRVPVQLAAEMLSVPSCSVPVSVISPSWHFSQQGPTRSCSPALQGTPARPGPEPNLGAAASRERDCPPVAGRRNRVGRALQARLEPPPAPGAAPWKCWGRGSCPCPAHTAGRTTFFCCPPRKGLP